MAKNANTSTDPATAASSGRDSHLLKTPTSRTSSPVPVVACVISNNTSSVLKGVPMPSVNSLAAQLDDVLSVVLGHERRSGRHGGNGSQPVLYPVDQGDGRGVGLQKHLLIDGEQQVTLLHGLEHFGRDVECGDLNRILPARAPDRPERLCSSVGAEREHPIYIRVLSQRRLYPVAHGSGVRAIHRDHLDVAPDPLVEAFAPCVQHELALLVVDAERVLYSRLCHALAGLNTRFQLGL